jgi:putative ABC transport system permease protein
LAFEGMLGNGSISALFVATAIDPRAELEVCPRRHISMDPQQKLDPRDASGIFIGSVLAEGLSAKPGTTLFASSSTQAGAPNALDVVLRGTLPESGGIFENKAGAIVPLATAQELLRMPGRVTEYVLSTEDLEQAPRIAGELRKLLGNGYEVKIWRDWPHIRGLYQLMDVMGTVWASLLSVLVISVIMNTMLMSIFERVREIGTMLAIGIRRRQVMTLFLIESGILGFFGALGGAALGMGIIRLTAGGIPLPATEVSGKLLSYPFVTPGFVVGSGLAAILVAVLASLYPAWKGSRMKPVDALREAS